MSPETPAPSDAMADLGPVIDDFTARGAGERKGDWTVTLFRDAARVEKEDVAFVYTRAALLSGSNLILVGGSAWVLPRWTTGLGLDTPATQQLRRWMGADLPRWFTAMARRRLRSELPVALVTFVLAALSGGWFLGAYGLLSIGIAIATTLHAGRWVALAQAGRSGFVTVILVVEVALGLRSGWWSVLILALVWSAWASLQRFAFFRPVEGDGSG